MPGLATTAWQKEQRQGVFIDYNQNAKDRTVASAYSVRPLPDARVSFPLHWDELADAWAEDYTLLTVPDLYAKRGDVHAGIDDAPGSLDSLLELAASQPKRAKRAPMPVITIGRHTEKQPCLDGLDRWKAKHPDVVPFLEPADVLVDKMRGRYSLWYRVRVNLQHVPEELRPAESEPDPNVDPTEDIKAWQLARMRKLMDGGRDG